MSSPNRYTCEEVFRRLDDYLDRELSDQEIEYLEQHLSVCQVCLREYEFEKSVINTLKSKVNNISAPEDLMTRISARLRNDA